LIFKKSNFFLFFNGRKTEALSPTLAGSNKEVQLKLPFSS